MLNERDPNDKTQFPSIEHDLTVEQRKERNEMIVSAKEISLRGRIFGFV